MTDNLYTILKNDCLSLLAEKFNVDTDVLVALNSELIKNPDLIYEGDKLKLPKKISDERWPLPDVPKCDPKVDTCSKERPMVDVLYVAADPIAGKRTWYSVTADAKQKILEEKQKMSGAIVEGDLEATKANLRASGLLSKFEQKKHEQFLESEQDIERYRTLAVVKLTIENNAFVVDGKDPDQFLLRVAEVLNFNVAAEFKQKFDVRSSINYLGTAEQMKAVNETMVNRALRSEIIKLTDQAIEDLETKAKKNAKGKVASDGTCFVYMEKLEFYSTKQQRKVYNAVKRLNGKSRTKRKKESDLTFCTVKESNEYLEQWKSEMQKSWQDLKDAPPLVIARRNDIYFYDAQSIHSLNLNGYAVKEQCLTPKQLFGDSGTTLGPKALAGIDWRKEEGKGKAKALDINNEKIEALYEEVVGTSLDVNSSANVKKTAAQVQGSIDSSLNNVERNWAYYPTLALIALIDATVSKHKKALTQVLGSGQSPIDTVFSQLLWVKQVAQARLERLKKTAQANAVKGVGALQFRLEGDDGKFPQSFTLLWTENKFKPKRMNNSGFRNKAGYNDLQIVECAFASDGEVFYLRGPAWFVPGSDRRLVTKSNGHIVNITSKIKFASPSTQGAEQLGATSVKDALGQIFDKENVSSKMELIPIKVEGNTESTFWQESYHYQEGISPDGTSGAYSVDAGVQFLRFSAKGEAQLNTPLDSYSSLITQTKQIGAGGAISASFVALQGQMSVSFCLPLREGGANNNQKVEPFHLEIKYVDKYGKVHKYSAGFFYALITGQVYGLAGATCGLSAGVTIGPTDIGEGIGIRGNTIDITSPNIVDVALIGDSNLHTLEQAKVAADASVKGDIFAGVEAGGILTAEAFWFPPKETSAAKKTSKQEGTTKPPKEKVIATYDPKEKLKLAAISGKATVAAGVGASAEFGIKLQGGVFIFTAQAKLVYGAGCGGSLEMELNGTSLNQFVDCLLGVLKQSEFRRISAFGEVDANGMNKDFELLNDVLTIATALGLTFAKAMLLPFDVWDDYKKQALSQDYAPFLASKINEQDPTVQAKMRTWVVALPPETLANLLSALCAKQKWSRTDSKGDTIYASVDNKNQAAAVVKIMDWLAYDKNETDLVNQRQWKETLISMADLPYSGDNKNHTAEWQGYKESWFKLAYFVSQSGKGSLNEDFSRQSITLSKNMVLTQYDEVFPISMGATIKKYHAYPVENVINIGEGVGAYAKVVKKTGLAEEHWQLHEDKEVIINWSLDDVGL
ncbi:LysM domain-containing protein [Vibrio kasasachensis]|uniref:LysM peptidoglycan-binding domain-containing protein n=1 Tax=Vibrio kasasachensis TaxID=2910248 RepID=UPI003D0ACCBF